MNGETPEQFIKSRSKDLPHQCRTKGDKPAPEKISGKGYGTYMRVGMGDGTIVWGFNSSEAYNRFVSNYEELLVGDYEPPTEVEEPEEKPKKRRVIRSKKTKQKPVEEKPVKKPIKKKEPEKPTGGGAISVSDIASKLGMLPRQARAILRKEQLTKPEGGWSWNASDARKIERLLKDNK